MTLDKSKEEVSLRSKLKYVSIYTSRLQIKSTEFTDAVEQIHRCVGTYPNAATTPLRLFYGSYVETIEH